jgi:hypothetical protein
MNRTGTHYSERIVHGRIVHHLDAYPDSACHFDADLDPACPFDADSEPACHVDEDPDPTFHFYANPDPSFQIWLKTLQQRSNVGTYSIHFGLSSAN